MYMTCNTPTAFADFRLNDVVRLLVQRRGVAAGSVGRVLGKFARPGNTTFVVCFVQDKVRALELPPGEVALVDVLPAAA